MLLYNISNEPPVSNCNEPCQEAQAECGYLHAMTMRIATWNVNSLSVRLPQVLDWLQAQSPDVLALQETKLTDDRFPHADLLAAGYHSVCLGQPTYNGVALLSRTPPTEVQRGMPGLDDSQARVIAAAFGEIRVIGAYFPNGQAPGSDKFAYKMRWLDALQNWLVTELEQHAKVALVGDFNIAPEDRDVYDPVAWAGQIHCTPEERGHFASLLGLGMIDAFRAFDQPPKSWSWWDYRNLAFRKNQGLRIDHILLSQALRASLQHCVIDKTPRKNERPSDHAPVVADLDL